MWANPSRIVTALVDAHAALPSLKALFFGDIVLNQRAGIDLIFERLGPKNWAAIQAACERVMTECFPSSLYAGLDVLVTSDYQRHAVLEVNAFGDLLPDVLDRGQDTYAAEIKAVLDRCHA